MVFVCGMFGDFGGDVLWVFDVLGCDEVEFLYYDIEEVV